MNVHFMDQWKATRNLTVNFGLRYDRTFIPPYGKQAGIPAGIETGNYDLQRGVICVLQVLPPTCIQRGSAPCIPGDGNLPAERRSGSAWQAGTGYNRRILDRVSD